MSFWFSVGDIIALGNLTFQLYKSIKDAPGEFKEISRELGSFHIVILEMQDQAQDKSSLLNRRGAGWRQELLSLCANMQGSLKELDALFKEYQNMGNNVWLMFQMGQQKLSGLRAKLNLQIGCINQFMGSLTMADVGRMEPMIGQILRILRDSAKGERSKAQIILSAHMIHNEGTWAPVELELRTGGIPVDYIQANRDRIEALVDKVVQEEGFSTFRDIDVRDSISQRGSTHKTLSTPLFPHHARQRQRARGQLSAGSGSLGASSSTPINATPAEVEAATILLMNHGFDLRNFSKPNPKPKPFSFTTKSKETDSRNNDTLAEALCWAVKMGKDTALRLILQKDVDPSAKHNGTPAVAYAVQNENEVMLRLLLDYGADINSRRSDDKSLIHIAVLTRNEVTTRLLLERSANIESIDSDGNRPLHLAIQGDLPAIVKLLLDNGARPEVQNNAGNWPLHMAIAMNNQLIVDLLLDKGAAVEAPNKQDDQPLHLAVANGHQGIASLLLQQGASLEVPSLDREYPIHRAAIGGDAMMRFLLQKGASIKSQTKYGSTPLHLAAAMGHLETVKLLLEIGADIEVKNTYTASISPTTPLQLAIVMGRKAVEDLLISKGADNSDHDNRHGRNILGIGFVPRQYNPLEDSSVDGYLARQIEDQAKRVGTRGTCEAAEIPPQRPPPPSDYGNGRRRRRPKTTSNFSPTIPKYEARTLDSLSDNSIPNVPAYSSSSDDSLVLTRRDSLDLTRRRLLMYPYGGRQQAKAKVGTLKCEAKTFEYDNSLSNDGSLRLLKRQPLQTNF